MRIKLHTENGRDIEDITTITIDGIQYNFNNSFYYPAVLTKNGDCYSLEGDLDELTTYDLRWHKEYIKLLESMPEVKEFLAKARMQIGEIIARKEQEIKRQKAMTDAKIKAIIDENNHN